MTEHFATDPVPGLIEEEMPLTERSRLIASIEWSREKLQPFRENRNKFVRQYVGFNYAEEGQGSSDKVPVNMMELAINIFSRHLAASKPMAMVRTPHPQLKSTAYAMELALDQLVDEIGLGKTLRELVVDALVGVGIIKTGLHTKSQVEIGGFLHDVGQPFAERVDLDDWVHDMAARTWEQIAFCGNRYRIPIDDARNSGMFNEEAAQALQPTRKSPHNEDGDEKIETISSGFNVDRDEYTDYVELWDIWLPRENMILTLSSDDGGAPADNMPLLREEEWQGPERGPYHLLAYSEVPNQIMPLCPASTWFDLHTLLNKLFVKQGRGAERRKTFLAVQAGAKEDAEAVRKASDGDIIPVDNIDKMQEVTTGGVDTESIAFTVWLKDLFTYTAGNIDSLGGLGPQSDTATQDRMLSQSASKRVSDMQDRTIDFTELVMRDLAWYLWTDPLIEIPIIKRVPGTDLSLPSTFTPADAEGDFLDYNFKIEPYSMQHQSPGSRLQVITNLFQQFLLPMAPLMQTQGIGINFEGLLRLIGRYTNMTELDDMITFVRPIDPQAQAGPQGGTHSTSFRVNERRNIPGSSVSGKDEAFKQALLGAGQPDSTASLFRPTG